MFQRRNIRLIVVTLAVLGGSLRPAVAQHAEADGGALRWSNVPRVMAFGDVHGAYDELVALLQGAALIDEQLAWTGGTTHLVSLGDLLDRGPRSADVLALLMRLQSQAGAAGGAVHVVLGNHELMNLSGDLRYLRAPDYVQFAADETVQTRDAAFVAYQSAGAAQATATTREAFDAQFPRGYFARSAAFAPTGTYGAWLLKQPMMIVINDTAFVHGGLAPMLGDTTLQSVNEQFHRDLLALLEIYQQLTRAGYDTPRIDALAASFGQSATQAGRAPAAASPQTLALKYVQAGAAPIFSERGPLWYRGTALCHLLVERSVIDAGLAALGANRVVIGHTPTRTRRVMQRDDGKVIMLDTGMLQAYYHGHPALLVIEGASVGALYTDAPTAVIPILAADEGLQPLGWSRTEAEQFLAQAAIVESHPRAEGKRGELALDLRDGQRLIAATFVPLSAKEIASEVAAYRIDGLLELNLVPITVTRSVDGKRGVVASAPRKAVSEAGRVEEGLVRPNWCGAGNDYQLMYVFDALLGKAVRTTSEIVYDRNSWRTQLTGNAQAFTTTRKLAASNVVMQQPLPKSFAVALRGLDQATLRSALGDLLNARQIDALLARRDAILKSWRQDG